MVQMQLSLLQLLRGKLSIGRAVQLEHMLEKLTVKLELAKIEQGQKV